MLNKCVLIGRVGKDPETKHFDNNQVCNFTLATSETYKDKNGNKTTNTEWHKIVLWGKLAEIADKYVKKGDLLCVIGKIIHREYEAKDGSKKYITEIVGTEMTMLGNKGDSKKEENTDLNSNNDDLNPEDEVDNLPF